MSTALAIDLSDPNWESYARSLFEHLNEKQRRWFAGMLAEILGWGGTKRVAEISGLDPKTIRQGRLDLKNGLDPFPTDRIRRPGAGRPPLKKTIPTSDKI